MRQSAESNHSPSTILSLTDGDDSSPGCVAALDNTRPANTQELSILTDRRPPGYPACRHRTGLPPRTDPAAGSRGKIPARGAHHAAEIRTSPAAGITRTHTPAPPGPAGADHRARDRMHRETLIANPSASFPMTTSDDYHWLRPLDGDFTHFTHEEDTTRPEETLRGAAPDGAPLPTRLPPATNPGHHHGGDCQALITIRIIMSVVDAPVLP